MTQPERTQSVPRTEAGWYGDASTSVLAFLQRLRTIPAHAWMQATAREPAHPVEVEPGVLTIEQLFEEQAAVAARHRLHDALAAMPHVVRRIRERINAELAIFGGIVPELSLQRMRRGAHLAAFALAARPLLPREDVERLYRPFAALIPPPPELLPGK